MKTVLSSIVLQVNPSIVRFLTTALYIGPAHSPTVCGMFASNVDTPPPSMLRCLCCLRFLYLPVLAVRYCNMINYCESSEGKQSRHGVA